MTGLTLFQRLTLTFWATLIVACGSQPLSSHEERLQQIETLDVLLLSDHTLPDHLNLSSGGANGEERRYIDPTLKSLAAKLEARGLRQQILNVEDMLSSKRIATKSDFDLAYARYDELLTRAVERGVTLLSIHYDADKLYANGTDQAPTYIGGAQVILDDRAVSNQTLRFANRLIFDNQVLTKLAKAGLRIRPEYDEAIRYQANLTLNIAGHSTGGAALLEIGPQEQAVALFGSPDNIVQAIDEALNAIVDALSEQRATAAL